MVAQFSAWLLLSSSLRSTAVTRQELLSAHKVSLAYKFVKGDLDLNLFLLPPFKGVLILPDAVDDVEVPVSEDEVPGCVDEDPDTKAGACLIPITDSSLFPGRPVNLSLTSIQYMSSSSSLNPVFLSSFFIYFFASLSSSLFSVFSSFFVTFSILAFLISF